jgi:hypothetical protein
MEDFIEKLWSKVKGWADKNTQSYVCAHIPKERTDLTDPLDTIKPHRDYFRIWMNQMFLAKETEWFTDWYPAVHTSVELKFAGQTVKVGHVTGPDQEHTRGVKLDYAVTDLLPFVGGKVGIESGLIALKGKNNIAASVGILQEFSGLIGAPLSQALSVAKTVSSGMDKLVSAHNGEVRLAFHKEFVSAGGGGSELKPGYIAIVGRSDIDESLLSVKASQLMYGRTPAPLDGCNYILFRIEGRSERDDWRFPNIEEAMQQAIEAGIKGKNEDFEGYKMAARLGVWASQDLAQQDKRRVIGAIEAEIKDALEGGHGATAKTVRSLDEVMKLRAISLDDALRQPPLRYQDIV